MTGKIRCIISRLFPRKKTVETIKSVLIVLLAVSAAALAGEAGLYDGGRRSALSSGGGGSGAEGASEIVSAAAEPYAIAVTPRKDSHMGVMWNEEKLGEVYSHFSAALGEALGSSGEPEKTGPEEWEEALNGPGVYFDFFSDQQLSVLAGWLGTDLNRGAGAHTARRICLSCSGDNVSLYYIRERKNEYYRCETALSWNAVYAAMADCKPNGSAFVFEEGGDSGGVDRYFLVMPDQPSLEAVSASDSFSAERDAAGLLTAFGFQDYLASLYPEADGTQVYVQGDSRLSISPDGTAEFSGAGTRIPEMTPIAVIERCRLIVRDTLGSGCGAAELNLSDIYYNKDKNTYTLSFDYRVSGLPVRFSDGRSAAEFTVTDGKIAEARLVFRHYTPMGTGVSPQPLPAAQETALVRMYGGGEPLLCWSDDMSSLSAHWVIR